MLKAVSAATHNSQILARAKMFRIFLAEKFPKQRTWRVTRIESRHFRWKPTKLFFIYFDLSPCLKRVEIVKSFIVDFTAFTPLLSVRSIFHALTAQFCLDFASLFEYYSPSHHLILTKRTNQSQCFYEIQNKKTLTNVWTDWMRSVGESDFGHESPVWESDFNWELRDADCCIQLAGAGHLTWEKRGREESHHITTESHSSTDTP